MDGTLTITGGTLNGGISARLGTINISGGTINATTGDIDPIAQYYNYSGNVWLPDAMYLWNGTYKTTEGETADLIVNITGGTFNCTNGKGSAFALYDLGKVAENTTITISDNATFNTTTAGREAIKVLNQEDMGITTPASGYFDPQYLGKYTLILGENENARQLANSEASLKTALANESVSKIVLNADINSSDNISVPEGATATIDLNGNNLTLADSKNISVKGNLTVSGTGKISTTYAQKSLFDVDGGTLTLNGGTFENNQNDGYGILVQGNGNVVVNEGVEINSNSATISGNNTYGSGNITINGGTFTSTTGASIYKPMDGTLTITGGTLNGGISARLGTINISGGTINATTGDIDPIAQYYNYSGNVWLPDAMYLWNGTYKTTEGETADLIVNITGGTFNCTNGKGSAFALYDLGKVAENTTITISDNATFNTTTAGREAIKVLNQEDMGITTPASGYFNSEYLGTYTLNIEE